MDLIRRYQEENRLICGNCKKILMEEFMIKTDKYGRKECNEKHPYDYNGGQWYHPSAVITPANYYYFNEYYCPICNLTFCVELAE